MNYLAAFLVIFAVSSVTAGAMAADPLTTNGVINATQNQANQRIDQFQAQNAGVIPPAVNQQIDAFQGTMNGSFTTIKANNPSPNTVSPIQSFTIPAFPTLPH
jgi:hypothetical protein